MDAAKDAVPAPTADTAPAARPGAGDDAPVRALVVDDDPVVRRLVCRGLNAAGFEHIEEATDGVAAQAVLLRRSVDLVVTDLLMPRLDGLGLMRWAATHAPGPVWIILSGVDRFDAAVAAIRLGAYEFLAKPPHVSQLETVARNALRQRQLTRERARLFEALEASHRTLLDKVQQLEAASEATRRDLRRAEIIQRVLLPNRPPALSGLCLQSFYRPGHFVGGDLYNVVRLGDDHVAIYVADATGHGVSSAMLSVLFHRRLALLDETSGRPLPPAEVLAAVNRAICSERIAPGLFLTAAYCLLDTARGAGAIALAGHPPALLRRADRTLARFERSGPALGLTDNATYRDESFTIQPGDRLLLYTDGLLDELRGASGPAARLEAVLAEDRDDGRAIIDALADAVAGAHGHEAERDDLTLLLIEAGEGPSRFDNGGSPGDEPSSRAATPARTGAATTAVHYGESDEWCVLALHGRATWQHADALYETAAALLEEGRPVLIDLAACEYLDSTVLGTLHEITRCAEQRQTRVELQRVPESVAALFHELSLQRVLDRIRETAHALPELRPLRTAGEPGDPHARVLSAHEALAAVSPQNREKFSGVLDALRKNGAGA